MNEDERYWIDSNPIIKPFEDAGWAVVDECAGGVIAYFNSEEGAMLFVRSLKAAQPMKPQLTPEFIQLNTYTTTCITWADGFWDTEAETPIDAAVKHAILGWGNDDVDSDKREPVVVRVSDQHGALYKFRVWWCVEAGPKAEEQFGG